jgi:hypothetical protein
MDRLNQGLAWSAFGPVFPAFEVDTWKESRVHTVKTPDTKRGHLDATHDQLTIQNWWSANPNRLVGLALGNQVIVLDIDVDLDKGEDGFNFLLENNLETPESYSQMTPSGGKHIFYRNPGKPLGPDNNYRSPDKRTFRTGIDRKTGSSYVIAYSETPPKLAELSDAPEWLLDETKTAQLNEYSGTLDDWLENLNPATADFRVVEAIKRFPTEDFDHQVMITKQTELVLLGAGGHPGIPEALELLQALWLFGEYDTHEYRIEWTAALEGAVRKFGGPQATKENNK